MISPNVKTAKSEQLELEKRYKTACNDANQRKVESKLHEFEQEVQQSYATINMPFEVLYNIANGDDYKNYYDLVKLGLKEYDPARVICDTKLFGEDAAKIRYAALNLDSVGLTKYGDFCICLDEKSIQDKTSLLEENAFNFFNNHPIKPKENMPKGYRAVWENRDKLAVAKLGKKIDNSMHNGEFSKLLLEDKHNKDEDEFIEVHIYGKIDFKMMTEVWADAELDLDEDEQSDLIVLQELLGDKWQSYKQK